MRWFVVYKKDKGKRVTSFDTKEEAEHFASLIGKDKVERIYSEW